MSFTLRLAADLVSVEAGVTVPLSIEIVNRNDDPDRYELEIEGLDPEWTAVPVPVVSVDARELATEKIFFRPGRVSESVAGNYPFVVKVRSLGDGESRSVQGVLEIKPFNHLTTEISPKKGVVSPAKKQNEFQVTFVNLGNVEHTLQLFGNDPDDQCTFDFEQEQLSLSPGAQKSISVVVTPAKKSLFSGSRLHGFSIGGRSIESPSTVCSATAQLEQRPLLSPSSLVALFIALILIAGLWITRPQNPVLESLMLSKSTAKEGEEITVSWSAAHARGVTIMVDGQELFKGAMVAGSKSFVATATGTVVAVAWRDTKESAPQTLQFTVTPPVIAPDPEIESFDILPKTAAVGQTLTLKYKFSSSVTKATLLPRGLALDPKIDSIQFELDQPGTVSFYIVAENADGKTKKSRSLNVVVQQVSTASVVVFRVEPSAFDNELGGPVKITWQLENAVRAELVVDGVAQPLPDLKGEMEFSASKTTTLKLVGYDSKGLTVSDVKTITVKAPPPDETTTGGQ